jgi:hypothetical protein
MKKNMLCALLTALLLLATVAVYAVKDDPIERFDINPNPMQQDCTISLDLLNPMNITIQIQNPQGALISEIYRGYANKQMLFTWDRTDYNNQYVPNGEYVVVLSFDTRYTSTKKTLILK